MKKVKISYPLIHLSLKEFEITRSALQEWLYENCPTKPAKKKTKTILARVDALLEELKS